jgi:teichuronic acid biosynthesis glycosyltransferase TuaG
MMGIDSSPIAFSVIIPTYNRASLLRELLNSFLVQTYKKFELIICDDGSTDDTSEVISEFSDRLNITYEVFKNTGGPAYPRNRGIELSKNDWVCFLDSDDLWTNDKLQVLVDHITLGKSSFFCHPVYLINAQNQKIGIIGKYKKSFFLSDFESLLYNGSQVVNSSLCVKRSLLSTRFFYNTDPEYQAIEDYIFILNLTYSGEAIKCIPNVLGYYRVHGSNISADLSKQISKWKKYFSTRPFKRANYAMIDNLILYLESSMGGYTKADKISIYTDLLFSKHTSFQIKKKSIAKLFLTMFKSF